MASAFIPATYYVVNVNLRAIPDSLAPARPGKRGHRKNHTQCSKTIIDKIDMLLAEDYGFTPEELDFTVNYDIKYRLGSDNENAEE